ncbi:MAG: SurA N-terminal domain-containing protein, partial [Pseudomonadota bacterium]|nr:SurA N-terminal domain-containing protein [Pseudomonadota bacterium]
MKKTFVSLLIALSLIGATAQSQTVPVDRIAAVVNEDVILQSELDRAMRNVLSQYSNRQEQLPPREVLEKQVLERIVLVRLQVARAESSGIKVSDSELDNAVNGVAAQNQLTLDQLRVQLTQDGVSYP